MKTIGIEKNKYTIKREIARSAIIIFFILFIITSILYSSPTIIKEKSNYNSSQLKLVTIKGEDKSRSDYLNEDNKITIAAELGYSTIIVIKTENGEVESYYDDQGKPTYRRYSGYYAVSREYNEYENTMKVKYLDKNGSPKIIVDGYAEEIREYNDKGQISAVRYYDENEDPILTEKYGYGKINEYNENGEICRVVFIDKTGNPMITGQGYAIATRYYYPTTNNIYSMVESEFYFDTKGNPIALSLGQYGVHKEYDEAGRTRIITYLNAEGEPINTNKGYATIEKTFLPNGKTASEKYYDMNGKPFALSEGQYGVIKENNQTIFLDQNGRERFNLRNILYNHSWIIVPCTIILLCISSVLRRKWNAALAIVYILLILYLTLMFREKVNSEGKEFLHSYRTIFVNSESRADILKNIWLFIPLSSILYNLFRRKTIIIFAIALSVVIELIQYYTGTGFCELDDIISNSIGTGIGFLAGVLTTDVKHRIKMWRQTYSA